jgi:hypothetical protein
MAWPDSSLAAEGRLEGTVRFADGSVVAGATVSIEGSTISTTTDALGRYVIADTVRTGMDLLIRAYLTSVGEETRKVFVVPGRNVVDFTLKLSMGTEVEVTVEIPLMNATDGISRVTLSPEQISVLPSLGEQDIFRALQLLPGVRGSNETSSGLYVRGGTPDQNLTSYDGFTVYHVDHLFGYFSAFNMDAVEEVQLSKGAFEARHGGRMSSVLEITGKTGKDKPGFGAGASLLSVHGMGHMPLGGKTTLLVAGRRSFQGPLYNKILNLFTNNVSSQAGSSGPGRFGRFASFNSQPVSSFYDLNAKLQWKPDSKNRLTGAYYRGNDDLDNSRTFQIPDFIKQRLRQLGREVPSELSIQDESGWANAGASAQWARQWSSRVESRVTLAWSHYGNDRERSMRVGTGRGGLLERNTVDDLTARLDVPITFGSTQLFQLGGQVTSNDIAFDFESGTATAPTAASTTAAPRFGVLDRDERGRQIAAYAQHRAQFGKLLINPGVRYTTYDRTSEGYVEPRLSASYQATPSLRLKAAVGRHNQFASRIVREDLLQGNRDFWTLSDGQVVPVSNADHVVAGFSYESKGFLLDVEAFRKDMDGLAQFAPRFSANADGIDYSPYFYPGSGEAQGIECMAQKKFGRHTGWVSYTLSNVEHTFPELSAGSFPADYDQRHEAKAVGSLRFGKWTLSSTFVYASGKPYTEPTGTETVSLFSGGPSIARVVAGEKNGARLPFYDRLDLSAQFDFRIGGGKGTLGLTVFNAYDQTNVWYREFNVVQGEILENNILLMGRTLNAHVSLRF